ncbi:hypothetical protein GCM10027452_00770 [Micromonospora halotolerans]
MARIAGRFRRVEPRRRARAYVLGLLSPLAGKNGWTLAEAAGENTPSPPMRPGCRMRAPCRPPNGRYGSPSVNAA